MNVPPTHQPLPNSFQPGDEVIVDYRGIGLKRAQIVNQLPGSKMWQVLILPEGQPIDPDHLDRPVLPWGTFLPISRARASRLAGPNSDRENP